MALWSQKYANFKKQNLRLVGFPALDQKFVLALEPKIVRLEGSSFGNTPYIFVLMGWYDSRRIGILKHCEEKS